MNKNIVRLRRGTMILVVLVSLAACGEQPAVDESEALTNDSGQSSRLIMLEETTLLNNPVCGEAATDLAPTINKVVDRFNQIVVPNWELPLMAGHPDRDGGIAVRVCADGRLAAYTYPNTVVIHEGLLRTLQTRAKNPNLFLSAIAFVIYHELGHAEMGDSSSLLFDYHYYGDPFMERRADAFAAAAVVEAGFDPDGGALVFDILEEMNPDGTLGHPAPASRGSL